MDVSIHASAREATRRRGNPVAHETRCNPRLRTGGDYPVTNEEVTVREVSIHASAREATGAIGFAGPAQRGFNPRLRTGGDTKAGMSSCDVLCFNPRLRTGGDDRAWRGCWFRGCFNPRLRTGGDMAVLITVVAMSPFQSTPPHGRRRGLGACQCPGMAFQSTPPHGRRRSTHRTVVTRPGVSIHASAREATWARMRKTLTRTSFNPRLRTGGDAS